MIGIYTLNPKFTLTLLSFAVFLPAMINAQIRTEPTPGNPINPKNGVVEKNDALLSAREIANRVLPSTVMIITQGVDGDTIAQGSGFVYKPGLIATNLHVFDRATKGFVKFVGKGETFKIEEIVGINRRRDICVFRIGEILTKPLPLAISAKTQVGDDVFVASNPNGLEGSFSKGIVSAIRQNIGLIQIDAAISHGSSGGAVVNSKGEAVGIVVSSVTSGQNLNFVIPIEYLISLRMEFKEPVSTAGALAFNDRVRQNLRGLVKDIEETTADFEYAADTRSFVEQPPRLAGKEEYDIYGNYLAFSLYLNGNLMGTDERTYDAEGFLRSVSKKLDLSASGKELMGSTREFSVMESIRAANEGRNFDQTNSVGIGKTTYDKNGREIENFVRRGDSSVRTTYTYNQNGFIADTKIYRNDKLVLADRYSYLTDEQGNWVKKVTTSMVPDYPDQGYIPAAVNYRKIRYFE